MAKFRLILLALCSLTSSLQAQVCGNRAQSQLALSAALQGLSTVRNPLDDIFCSERAPSRVTSEVRAQACRNLHQYSCSQSVLRDPLSASYAADARNSGTTQVMDTIIAPAVAQKLPQVMAQVTAASPALRSKIKNCARLFLLGRVKRQPDLRPCNDELSSFAVWNELREGPLAVAGGEIVALYLQTIDGSRKARVVKDVIVPEVRSLALSFLGQVAPANGAPSAELAAVRRRLENLSYVTAGRGGELNMSMDVFEDTAALTCTHQALLQGSLADIAHGIAHEVGHVLDPCSWAAHDNLANYPFRAVLQCLDTRTDFDIVMPTDGFDCGQSGEAFADLFAARMIPQLLDSIYADRLQSPEDYVAAYASIGRSSDDFCGESLSADHPPWSTRINQLLLSNPLVRQQMGCEEVVLPTTSCLSQLPNLCP